MSSNFPAPSAPLPRRIGSFLAGLNGERLGLTLHAALAAVLVALVYGASAKVGFAFTFQPRPISVVWLPNAILLAGLLLTPARAWWFVMLAVLPVHLAVELQSGVPSVMVLAWYVSNCSEALIGAALLRWLVRAPLNFNSLAHAGAFLVCGVGIAPLLSTFLDVGLVKFIGWGQGDFSDLVRMRFLSNALAALIVVPVIITWSTGALRALRDPTLPQRLEIFILFIGLLLTGTFVFESSGERLATGPALLYAPIPFLLWAAVRLGQKSVTLCLLLTFVLATWGAVHGHGPFVDGSAEENALSVQLFLIAVAAPFLLFSAVIAEHRRDRRAVAASEQRALTVFRAGPDAMAIVRLSDGAFIDVNDRWVEIFGFAREEALGRNPLALGMYVNPEAREAFISQTMRGGARNFEAELLDKGGNRHDTLLTSDRVDIGGTDCLVNVIRDITGQKEAEREARQQRLEVTHLSRVAVLGELSGALAHELNQPLTAILSNAQTAQRLIARDKLEVPELKEILEDITRENKRAGEVIRRLRAMFKKGEPQFIVLDLNDLMRDTLILAGGSLATRHVEVATTLCNHALSVRGDRVQLQQVLLNLIVNACEAMEAPGSARTLSLETTPLADGRVQVLVRDGGTGVPEPVMARLFDPFFTTKAQGLGLGLSISRSIVAAHGGELLARNNPDRGATFRILLPAHA